MQVTARLTLLLAAVGAVLDMAVCAPQSAPRKPRPVEVWRVGDDGLTSKLTDTLEAALGSSQDFALSSGKKPGTLVVTIPNHVRWKTASGGRPRVIYTVEFSSVDAQVIGRANGTCWDDSLLTCAAQIIKDAKVAARKMH